MKLLSFNQINSSWTSIAFTFFSCIFAPNSLNALISLSPAPCTPSLHPDVIGQMLRESQSKTTHIVAVLHLFCNVSVASPPLLCSPHWLEKLKDWHLPEFPFNPEPGGGGGGWIPQRRVRTGRRLQIPACVRVVSNVNDCRLITDTAACWLTQSEMFFLFLSLLELRHIC